MVGLVWADPDRIQPPGLSGSVSRRRGLARIAARGGLAK